MRKSKWLRMALTLMPMLASCSQKNDETPKWCAQYEKDILKEYCTTGAISEIRDSSAGVVDSFTLQCVGGFNNPHFQRRVIFFISPEGLSREIVKPREEVKGFFPIETENAEPGTFAHESATHYYENCLTLR